MKYNLLVTQECNLRCDYCYIGKKPATMSIETAKKVVDFIFARTPDNEKIHIGFFGGEPLLAFQRIEAITAYIEDHPEFDPNRVELAIVTNGTRFSDAIARFISEHRIIFGISCDGPAAIHNRFRHTKDGNGSSELVAHTIGLAVDAFDRVLVNAVYHPDTFRALASTVEYLSDLGVRHIYLNADYSAPWRSTDIAALPDIYQQVADRYIRFYLNGQPHFISLIDSKITVLLRNGYAPEERCRMGKGEMAFAPDGSIYPCERLVGAADSRHCIGHVDKGIVCKPSACHLAPASPVNPSCLTCSIRDYCMNWCGCSNYFATGYYNRVNEFICTSEKAALNVALKAFQTLEHTFSDRFSDHMAGYPQVNARSSGQG